MHENNCFITLTYSDEKLRSPSLIRSDFDEFMKKLRHRPYVDDKGKYHSHSINPEPILLYGIGEYGAKTKRPHWHAILFNYDFIDKEPNGDSESGHKIFKSRLLDDLWSHNDPEKCPNQIGSVTIESAGYCARYNAKQLVHGHDGKHPYKPISIKSRGLGNKFLEQFWPDVFSYGYVQLDDGQKVPVPRYYNKWLEKNRPNDWARYVTGPKEKNIQATQKRVDSDQQAWMKSYMERRPFMTYPLTRNQVRKLIKEQRFEELQNYLSV